MQKDRALAPRRIEALFEQIESMKPSQKTADSFVRKAWKLATANRIRWPAHLKTRFCRKCKSYWNSRTLRVRLQKKRAIYTCLVCRAIRRIPIKNMRRAKMRNPAKAKNTRGRNART
jgi:RNase P subunit RPR2